VSRSEEFVEKSIEKEHLPTGVDEIHVDDLGAGERIDRPVEKEGV